MNYENYIKESFESITDYRKIISIIFLIINDRNLLREIGFNKNDNIGLSLEFKKILIDQHEEYLDFVRNEDESSIEKIFNK